MLANGNIVEDLLAEYPFRSREDAQAAMLGHVDAPNVCLRKHVQPCLCGFNRGKLQHFEAECSSLIGNKLLQ